MASGGITKPKRRPQGTAFTEGRSIDELTSRATHDVRRLSASQLSTRYTRAGLQRLADHAPLTSLQVRSARLRDQHQILYTPVDTRDGQTLSFAARIPKSASRRITEAARRGMMVPAEQAVGTYTYPPPGTVLQLKRIHDGRAELIEATVDRTQFDPKTSVAVAIITMRQPVSTDYTETERRYFERVRTNNKRTADAAAIDGDAALDDDDDAESL